jgi:BirA family biotin operon repressor/biotin-[acetyl-CoA-carboxylase] ligase
MNSFHFDAVDSTNDEAKRLIAESRLQGRGYVLAREQTAGRGTQGRSWLSPRDAGVYLSVVCTDLGIASPNVAQLTLAAGAACVEAIHEWASLTVHLKPINDLVVGDRKLGGILTEIAVESGAVASLIFGIGINLRRAVRHLPPDAMPAVSVEELLPAESFRRLDAARLVESVADKVDAYAKKILAGDDVGIRSAWERYLLPGISIPSII